MTVRDQIVAVLNHVEWKTGKEIRQEIKEKYRRKLSIGRLYVTLEQLERAGMVEFRLGSDPEKMVGRGGNRYGEFRLTEAGIRHKIDIAERAIAPLTNLKPTPQTS